MDDLVTWLRAQLDEDERVALESQKPGVYWYMDGHSAEAFAHLTRWDPARVLAEVDAKRTRLAWCIAAIGTAVNFPDDPYYQGAAELAENVIKSDALPYTDRPGYRDEWKP